MATEDKQAALLCGICNETYVSGRFKAFNCGHLLCEGCCTGVQNSASRGTCPFCREPLDHRKTITIYPDLVVVDAQSSNVIQETRHRMTHLFDGLGDMLPLEDLRQVYNEARIARADTRNAASGSKNKELKTLAIALTDATDILEDQLMHTLEKEGIAVQARDYKKKLHEQKQRHTQETQVMKAKLDELKTKLKAEEEERKKASVKAHKYKEKLEEVTVEQEDKSRRADAAISQLEETRKELAQTKTERQHFQSQLMEHKTNETKHKQQIRELKLELKQLKEKKEKTTAKDQPQEKKRVSVIEVADSSFPADVSLSSPARPDDRQIINLVSSSPVPLPVAQSRKRAREPDENHDKRSKNMPLLPPPKARAAGSTRIPGEILEKVTVGANGAIKRKPTTAKKVLRSPLAQRPDQASSSKPKQPQLALGDGGKLVGIAKKKIPAV